MKPQDQLGTTKVGKTQPISTTQPSTSTILTLMVAGLRKIWRKFLVLRNQSIGSELSTPEKIITTREEATQVRDEATSKAKTNHCLACIMKMIQTIGQKIVQFS
jgi:hypothetical protein